MHEMQVIQYKRLVGNEQDASVQKDIEHAVDSVVQQLRLQVCLSFIVTYCELLLIAAAVTIVAAVNWGNQIRPAIACAKQQLYL